MFGILNNLGLLAGQNIFLAYFIIYIATIFLGNISAFTSFWVVIRGSFGPWGVPLLMLTIFCANFSGDMLWYSLGRTLHDTRLGNFVKNRLPQHDKIEKKLHKSGGNWMIISKFLYATSFPVIFLVGWSRVAFGRFVRVSLLSIAIWIPALTGLSYGLVAGLSPLAAVSLFKHIEIVFLLSFIVFFAIDYLLTRIFKILFGKWWGGFNGKGNGNDGSGDAIPIAVASEGSLSDDFSS